MYVAELVEAVPAGSWALTDCDLRAKWLGFTSFFLR
jgi:hypothetical protein